ncbi:MAG: hypothetical protein AB7O59_13640 [Pirellulales bacterium]
MAGSYWRNACVLFAALLVAGGCQRSSAPRAGAAAEDAEIAFFLTKTGGTQPSFAVMGIPASDRYQLEAAEPRSLADVLTVHVTGAGEDVPGMAGDVALKEDGLLYFQPRYPLRPGTSYRVVYHPARIPEGDKAARDFEAEFDIPTAAAQGPTSLVHVYPSGERLPENLLKFYLHFSAPMCRGEAYRRIHLLNADGKEVADPFLELGEELWDPTLERFTLLFDPGRIKRGLKPREEVGPVLEEGQRYTLVVDRDWLDAAGKPLEAGIKKSFNTLPPDEAPLDTTAWKIDPPAAGSSNPLLVRFPEPLDHSLLERVVRVTTAGGEAVPGKIEVTDGETCWRFTPAQPWADGAYQLVADTTLEDLAGNSIGRAFDVDVVEPIQKRITTDTVSLPFEIQSPN